MSRRHLGGLAAAALVGAALAAVPHGAVAAAPTHGQSARALAAQSARQLVASKPPALKVSAHDALPGPARRVLARHPVRRRTTAPTAACRSWAATSSSSPTPHGQILSTSVAQTHKVHLRSVEPTLGQGRGGRARRGTRSPRHGQHSGPPRRLAARRHVPARLGDAGHRAPGRRALDQGRRRRRPHRQGPAGPERVADGTGNSAWDGSNLTIPTTQSGSTYSMTDPNHPTIKCQNASNNTTFTGPDDIWGTGVEDRPRDGLRRRDVRRERREQHAVGLGRPQRPRRLRRRLADPDRPRTTRTPTTTAPRSRSATTPRASGSRCSTCSATSRVTASTTTPRAASPATAPRSSSPTRSARRPSGTPTTRSTPRTSPSARRSTWSAPARSATCTTRRSPVTTTATRRRIPNEEVHAAAGPGNHWFYLLAEGTNPTNGQPTSPTCNSSSVTGVGIQKAEQIMYNAMLMKTSSSSYLKYRTWTLTAAKNLDADLRPVQRHQGRVERRVGAGPDRRPDLHRRWRHQHRHRDQPGQPDRHRRHGQVAADDRHRLAVRPDVHLVGHRACRPACRSTPRPA